MIPSMAHIIKLTTSLLLWRQAQSFSPNRIVSATPLRRSLHVRRQGQLKFKQTHGIGELPYSQATTTTTASKTTASYSTSSSALFAVTKSDEDFIVKALEAAKNGLGRTYPNPAVGCVLVRQDTNEVIGTGFHPKAGFPHAEVFALMEATGHVASGVEAAKTVMKDGTVQRESTPSEVSMSMESIQALTNQYISEGGPMTLFGGKFSSIPVTAYVTLEPCCHTGKRTPPCAHSLALAGVKRVVVGFRDPNPSVDGAGVEFLEQNGIQVEMIPEGEETHKACNELIDSFVKRIVPKDYDASYDWITSATRSSMRRYANIQKADNKLAEMFLSRREQADDTESVDQIHLDAAWMEQLDAKLWKEELVVLRLNKAVKRKRLAKQLGGRIAAALGAYQAQTVGQSTLLYRPGIPPKLDLQKLRDEI